MKPKITLIAVCALYFFFLNSYAQPTYEWAKSIGSINKGREQSNGIAVDGSGNVYVTGYFDGTADFDPGAGTANLTSAGGSDDIFFAKYDALGNYLWAKSIGSSDNDEGLSIAVDGTGNVYVTGFFSGTADFDPGAGTANLTGSYPGYPGIFFAKYDASGNYLWARGTTGTNSGEGRSIAVDGSGNVYIAGIFAGTADFDPGAGTNNLTWVGGYDIFFAKYDASGNYIWAKSIGSTTSDEGKSIAVDGSGNVYITGYFQKTADFDPGAGAANLTAIDTSYNDIFFAKYNSNGNYLWAKNIGGSSDDNAYSVALDGSSNVYIAGDFYGTIDFDPGAGTANLSSVSGSTFFAKYDQGGNYLLAKNIGGDLNDVGNSIAVDGSGNINIIGTFKDSADFDPSAGTAMLYSVGVASEDIFFSKYDQNGDYLWVKNIGSTNVDEGKSIAVDGSGNVYITGLFGGTADFDPDLSGNANLISVETDICFATYDSSGNYLWAKSIGGSSNMCMDKGTSIALDGSGNVYITGYFSGTADFDLGAGTSNLISFGHTDNIFIAKYDALGNYLWAKNFGSYNWGDKDYSIAVDGSGNIYITGSFTGTADFDPGAGMSNLTSSGYTDIFFAKYDQNGNYLWAKRIGSSMEDMGNSIAVDGSGNVYITGYFYGAADFNPGVGTAYLYSVAPWWGGSTDIFFAKYDPSGNYIWAKSIGNGAWPIDAGKSIAVDGSGNVYIMGTFYDIVDFDPGAGTSNLGSSSDRRLFFAKYNQNGNYLWAKSLSSVGNGIAVDGAGNVYITGSFAGSIDFDPGAGMAILSSAGWGDIFFAKYNTSGNYLLARNIGGTNEDAGQDLAIDGNGNICITGHFSFTADFDPGVGTANLTGSYSCIFFAKYDAFGNYLWAGGTTGPNSGEGRSIAVDGSGNVYITGFFSGTADFDSGAGTANLTSLWSSDIFFAKYSGGAVAVEDPLTNIGGISIFPNPSSGQFQITIDNIQPVTGNMDPIAIGFEIYNVMGEKVYEAPSQRGEDGEQTIDISNQPNGIYFLNISAIGGSTSGGKTDGKSFTQKLIISR